MELKQGIIPLALCPFCGKSASLECRINDYIHDLAPINVEYFYVGCLRCGITTCCEQDKEKVIDIWNTRATSPYKDPSLSELYLTGLEVTNSLKAQIHELQKKNLEQEIKYEGLFSHRRKLEELQDELNKLNIWRDKQKEEVGYNKWVSFDIVWKETLEKANNFNRIKKYNKELMDSLEKLISQCSYTSNIQETYRDKSINLLARISKEFAENPLEAEVICSDS